MIFKIINQITSLLCSKFSNGFPSHLETQQNSYIWLKKSLPIFSSPSPYYSPLYSLYSSFLAIAWPWTVQFHFFLGAFLFAVPSAWNSISPYILILALLQSRLCSNVTSKDRPYLIIWYKSAVIPLPLPYLTLFSIPLTYLRVFLKLSLDGTILFICLFSVFVYIFPRMWSPYKKRLCL